VKQGHVITDHFHGPVVSPDGVAPSRIVGVSASVNLPLQRKVHKFSFGTGSPGWFRKNGRKTVVVVVVVPWSTRGRALVLCARLCVHTMTFKVDDI